MLLLLLLLLLLLPRPSQPPKSLRVPPTALALLDFLCVAAFPGAFRLPDFLFALDLAAFFAVPPLAFLFPVAGFGAAANFRLSFFWFKFAESFLAGVPGLGAGMNQR
jgi:hypothetical protein